jgi:lipopolysaccharide/colanic/teichoic acid biosynthesis glycosyltransferase
MIIVGVSDTTKMLRTIVDSNPMIGYRFEGYLSRRPETDADVIGHPDELAQIVREKGIDMVFVGLSLFSQTDRGNEFLKVCNKLCVKLRFIPENQSWFRSKLNMESVGNLVVINPQQIPLDDIEARIVKRLFDILFSLAFIVFIFSWFFPLIALLIKLSSKGPVFFVQERTGINNKTFRCLKFRSMRVNDDADSRQATAGDDRITALGRFMRRTNIDELPQFFNVLLGQMSVVGPRPHMLKHTEEYSALIDHYMVRHYVKPGVTGWAQGIAEAESIKAKGLADAESIKARGLAEAEAMEKKAEAMAKYGKAAMTEMIIKVLPQMAEAIAKPLESIDKVTIIDGGSGENGVGTFSGNDKAN